jgi:hypothetical protein
MEGRADPVADDHGDGALPKDAFPAGLVVNVAGKAGPRVRTLSGAIKERFTGRSGRRRGTGQADEQGDPGATPHDGTPLSI